jgi:carbamoyltransferase
MLVVGLNFGHDGSVAVVRDGKLLTMISSERITRTKKCRGVPPVVFDYALNVANIRIEDIDVFVVCNWVGDSLRDAQGQRSSVYNRAADGWQASFNDQPLTDDLYLSLHCDSEFWGSLLSYRGVDRPVVFIGHHLAHCAYSYFMSPYDDAISVALDVADESGATNAIVDFTEAGKHFRVMKRDSSIKVGLLYSQICDYLGFWPSVIGAGKVMALAAFGKPHSHACDFVWPSENDFFFATVPSLLSMLGLKLPQNYTRYPQLDGEGGEIDANWLIKDEWQSTTSTSLAATVQKILEDSLIAYLTKTRSLTTHKNICLSGGLFLNCVANGFIVRSGLFDNVFVAPACGDDGLSIGAAMLIGNACVKRGGAIIRKPRAKTVLSNREVFESGKWYSSMDIDIAIEKHRANLESRYVKQAVIESDAELADIVAQQIADGKIVGWFYRGSELGPRALGHRSILADPRRADMKDILNLKVKHREEFRPFAPSVLKEHAEEWFDTQGKDSPFMLISMQCKKPDLVPAVCHVDGSSRIQTVDAENNGRYYEVIKAFYEKTGVPCVVNTSFNVQGEPIVETPSDAIKCFLGTQIDVLVLENTIITK